MGLSNNLPEMSAKGFFDINLQIIPKVFKSSNDYGQRRKKNLTYKINMLCLNISWLAQRWLILSFSFNSKRPKKLVNERLIILTLFLFFC